MNRLDRLRSYRTNHWIGCVAGGLMVPFFGVGSALTFIMHPVIAICLGLIGAACVLIAIAQGREATRHGRLIAAEESRPRLTRL